MAEFTREVDYDESSYDEPEEGDGGENLMESSFRTFNSDITEGDEEAQIYQNFDFGDDKDDDGEYEPEEEMSDDESSDEESVEDENEAQADTELTFLQDLLEAADRNVNQLIVAPTITTRSMLSAMFNFAITTLRLLQGRR